MKLNPKLRVAAFAAMLIGTLAWLPPAAEAGGTASEVRAEPLPVAVPQVMVADPPTLASTHPGAMLDPAVMSTTEGGFAPAGASPLDNWVLRTSGTTAGLTSVAFGTRQGTPQFVAGGAGGTLLFSASGAAWSGLSTGSQTYFDVAAANDQFVLVGGDGIVDIVTGGLARAQFDTRVLWNAVAYGNGTWSVLGAMYVFPLWYDVVAWSTTNGQSWGVSIPQAHDSAGSNYLSSHFANGVFVATRWDGDIEYSGDGVNWYSGSSAPANTLHDVTFGNGTWVAVGNGGSVRRSTNGLDWTSHDISPSTPPLFALTFGGGSFVAAGYQGTILSSATGVGWTLRTAPTTAALEGAAYGADSWVAVGEGGTIVQTSVPPDLLPFTPPGWSGPLVLSEVPGTNVDDEIDTHETSFLDISWANFGGDAGPFSVQLSLDGVPIGVIPVPAGMPAQTYQMFEDIAITPITYGAHTLELLVDYQNEVEESDEANNAAERVFEILLHPAGVSEDGRVSLRVDATPNPSVGPTALRFALDHATAVRLEVFDAGGRQIRVLHDGVLARGSHVRDWDGRDRFGKEVAAGSYWVSVTTPETRRHERIVIAR
ncbi:MAG: hypothetical protein IT349_09135 [Candidatus Eisenbacteria bacterium]|nr:hypothetical protein [Candidatus Eisenbacteria bacterium]